MHRWLWLFATVIAGALANTEKLIFQADTTQRCASIDAWSNERILGELQPPFSQMRQVIYPTSTADNSSSLPHWFRLNNITPGSSYELRISYPAITPADFYLTLMDSCQLRDYLDIKSISTQTEDDLDAPSYWLLVEAHWTGISSQTGSHASLVTYDLVLETLYLGFLFYNVYKVVLAIAIVIFAGHWAVIPFVKQLVSPCDENKRD